MKMKFTTLDDISADVLAEEMECSRHTAELLVEIIRDIPEHDDQWARVNDVAQEFVRRMGEMTGIPDDSNEDWFLDAMDVLLETETV
jgi:hypothetical protein